MLREISLAVGPGEALLVRGGNGRGKSTLLRLLAGFRPPDAGTVRWDGADIAEDPAAYGARLAYLGHRNASPPGLTALENLILAPRPAANASMARAALAEAGLAPLRDLPAHTLSAGQQRRLALARCLLGAMPLWLLDEPAAGLDAGGRAWLEARLRDHLRNGGMAVIALHDDLAVEGRPLCL